MLVPNCQPKKLLQSWRDTLNTTFLCWLPCRVVSGRPSRSFLGPKLAQKSDFSRFTFINPPFRSQSDPTQCDHKSCIISYGIAWYCIVGFGVRAVSHKTPIYFIKWNFWGTKLQMYEEVDRVWGAINRLTTAKLVVILLWCLMCSKIN